jgi:hypothetical protein
MIQWTENELFSVHFLLKQSVLSNPAEAANGSAPKMNMGQIVRSFSAEFPGESGTLNSGRRLKTRRNNPPF